MNEDRILTTEEIEKIKEHYLFDYPISEMAEFYGVSLDDAVKMRVDASVKKALAESSNQSYKDYQLEWMIAHGYSLNDLMMALTDFQNSDSDADTLTLPVSELFQRWEQDVGFGSEIWSCEAEWNDSEGREQA